MQYGVRSHPSQPGREDADLWVDANGFHHAISHSFDRCGYHSFSRDGWSWSFAPSPGLKQYCAFSYDVGYANGSTVAFERRERPHIIFADDGVTPIGLTSSVTLPGSDASFTHLQPIDASPSPPTPQLEANASVAAAATSATSAVAATGRARHSRWPSTWPSAPGAMGTAGQGCEETGGNAFFLHQGGRQATLSRTGLEGLTGFDNGQGHATSYAHDDFALELSLLRPGGGGATTLALASAQDTSSRRNCSLMAAGCTRDGAAATFKYRCAERVQVTVEYSLPAADAFVRKSLAACALRPRPPAAEGCDSAATVRVLHADVRQGLQPRPRLD